MPVTDSYTNTNGDTIEKGKDNNGLFVCCWNKDNELQWSVYGIVVEDDGMRQKRRPFTPEEQDKEFNKWR